MKINEKIKSMRYEQHQIAKYDIVVVFFAIQFGKIQYSSYRIGYIANQMQ